MSSRHPIPQQFIAGSWRAGCGDAELAVVDPATEDVLARFPAAGAADITQALEAALAGFAAWKARTALDRAGVLRQAAQRLREQGDVIAALLSREQGKLVVEARREIAQAAEMIEWCVDEGRRAYGRTIPSRWPGTQYVVEPQPVGVVAAFTPWNFPVMLSAMKLAAALAAGCAVILKPAEETPSAVGELVRCFEVAGVDAGAVQMLLGVPGEISAALLASPVVRKGSFTGSVGVGRHLAELAGRHLKPMTLELGGHAPVIVCEDADVARAVDALASIKFRNAGQICANPSRFYVHRSRIDDFTRAFAAVASGLKVGAGQDPGSQMGPLANRRRVEAVQALVGDAVDQGARIACGGQRLERPGFFYLPTVLAEVPDTARVMREEPFGPVVPIAAFDSLDDVISRANALDVALAAFAFTGSIATARRLSQEVACGAIGINSVALMQAETPFGGSRDSGWGRENGSEGVAAYLSPRTVALAA